MSINEFSYENFPQEHKPLFSKILLDQHGIRSACQKEPELARLAFINFIKFNYRDIDANVIEFFFSLVKDYRGLYRFVEYYAPESTTLALLEKLDPEKELYQIVFDETNVPESHPGFGLLDCIHTDVRWSVAYKRAICHAASFDGILAKLLRYGAPFGIIEIVTQKTDDFKGCLQTAFDRYPDKVDYLVLLASKTEKTELNDILRNIVGGWNYHRRGYGGLIKICRLATEAGRCLFMVLERRFENEELLEILINLTIDFTHCLWMALQSGRTPPRILSMLWEKTDVEDRGEFLWVSPETDNTRRAFLLLGKLKVRFDPTVVLELERCGTRGLEVSLRDVYGNLDLNTIGDDIVKHVNKTNDSTILQILQYRNVDTNKIVYNDYSTHGDTIVKYYASIFSQSYMDNIRRAKGDDYYFRKTLDALYKGIVGRNVGLDVICLISKCLVADGYTEEYRKEYADFLVGCFYRNNEPDDERVSQLKNFDKNIIDEVVTLFRLDGSDRAMMLVALLQ